MHQFRPGVAKNKVPFWLPATNYYLFAVAASAALFFLLWGILYDGLDDVPLMIAVIVAGILFLATIFIREILLRSARERYISARRLDRSVRHIALHKKGKRDPGKLTLEGNEIILREIRKKSEAARVLGKFSEAHREVISLCEEYLAIASVELANAGAGSPRIPAIQKGSGLVSGHHRYHTLRWAEIEARSLTQEAKSRDKISEKLDSAQRALGILDHALKSYPNESSLVDSQSVLQEFLASIRVSSSVEKAERAFFKGNHKRAVSLYQDALFDLKRIDSANPELETAAEKIREEIRKIKQINKGAGQIQDKA
jgi:hypothetical protein